MEKNTCTTYKNSDKEDLLYSQKDTTIMTMEGKL